MKRNEKITHIMTDKPSTVYLTQKLSEARKSMAEGGFHHMPVVSGEDLVGLLSSTDLLRVSYEYGQDPRQTDAVMDNTMKIGELMRKEPITLSVNQTVRDAVGVFAEGRFHSLPVVDGDKLVGLVTTTDVMKYMLEQY